MLLQRYLVVSLLVVASTSCWADSGNVGDTATYKVVSLAPVNVDVAQMGLSNCTSMVALSAVRVLAACRSSKSDTPKDYGLRLYVLATEGQRVRALSVSPGLGDAYSVNLQKRSNSDARFKDLIVADAAAEHAYGAAIYALQGDTLRFLGELDYVLMGPENSPVSALEATKIEATREGFRVSFTQDVFALNREGDYEKRAKDSAINIFDGKRLHKVGSRQSARGK